MDILDIFKFAIAGVMMLLGLVLLFRKNKARESLAKQEETHESGAQFDLFSHLPLEEQKAADETAPLNVNVTSVNAVLRETSVLSPTGTVFPLLNTNDALTEQEQNSGLSDIKLPKAMRAQHDNAVTDFRKATVKEAVTKNTQPKANGVNSSEEYIDDDDFPVLNGSMDGLHAQGDDIAEVNTLSAEKRQWTGESALLDSHLEDQLHQDDHSSLAQAEQIISLYLLPEHGKLMGVQLLAALKKYGLRFGEMSLFHRYENPEGTGSLMFSVLQYTNDGPLGFDLEALAQDEIKGLAFFLGLPNPHAVHGYDMMVHISERLARDLNANLFDEDMNVITRHAYEFYRQQVVDYRPSSSI